MSLIQKYTIDVPQQELDLLQKKLELATLPDELEDSGWDYGAPLADIKRLVARWKSGYDWREHESRLNATLPQFTTDIDVDGFGTLNIHFVHQQSESKKAIPLLFCHGWPGHFLEVAKILPELVKGSTDVPAFHVVAPSLPNYGFSEGVKKRGFNIKHYSEVCHELMMKLGYTQYVTQGGDWGFYVTRYMGIHYPEHCRASHYNLYPSFPGIKNPIVAAKFYLQYLVFGLPKHIKQGLDKAYHTHSEGWGYFQEQSTKPQTIGYSQADSPVGLLAWIYEKLHDWTDSYPWSDDEVLTWVSLYSFSRAGPAAASRIYYETMKAGDHKGVCMYNSKTKVGVSRFPQEIFPFPTDWGHTLGPLVYEKEHDKGGHFAAYETPELIVSDLRAMFGKKGGAYASVQGKDGYQA